MAYSKANYQTMFNRLSRLDRDGRIGFLLMAEDDGVYTLPENWQNASDEQLAHWGVEAFLKAAEAMANGKTLRSELRGPKAFGNA